MSLFCDLVFGHGCFVARVQKARAIATIMAATAFNNWSTQSVDRSRRWSFGVRLLSLANSKGHVQEARAIATTIAATAFKNWSAPSTVTIRSVSAFFGQLERPCVLLVGLGVFSGLARSFLFVNCEFSL